MVCDAFACRRRHVSTKYGISIISCVKQSVLVLLESEGTRRTYVCCHVAVVPIGIVVAVCCCLFYSRVVAIFLAGGAVQTRQAKIFLPGVIIIFLPGTITHYL